jgi:hypothetical protein
MGRFDCVLFSAMRMDILQRRRAWAHCTTSMIERWKSDFHAPDAVTAQGALDSPTSACDGGKIKL